MAIVALTNSSSPATVERATADSDPYSRETQLNGLALNFDAHDHTSAKGLGVGRVQTASAPAASGQVRVSGDAWQWWGGTAAAVRTAVDVEGTQTVSGAKTLTSTLTLSPGAGQYGLVVGGDGVAGNGILYLASTGGQNVIVNSAGTFMYPGTDNAINLGHPSARWGTVYAVTGAINTSSREYKEGITPLDPAECYQAAKDVCWYSFAYLPPAYTEPEPPPDIAYDASDDNETKADKKAKRDEAEAQAKAAHLKMVVETAPARNQRGFVFPDGAEAKDEAGGALPPVPDLFGLSDRQSTTPQADLATLGCALQEVIRRLEALEAGGAA